MNMAKSETKVGLFSIIALLTIFFLFLWLSGAQILQRGKIVEAVFDRVEGLRPGASIQLAGVDIGRVSRIYFEGRQVIVVMRIQQGVQIPRLVKVLIASSGVVGDKFLDIIPCKLGEIPVNSKRLVGESPVTMEQFYATAFEVLDSLRTVAYSIKNFIADPEVTNSLRNTLARMDQITIDLGEITAQMHNLNIAQLFDRINHIVVMVERIAATNEPQLNDLVSNISQVTSQLAETTITANRFLKDIDNNGQTAANLKETIANAEKITIDLEKFTTILANKQQNIEQLLQDAHDTMQAIKNAADNINKVVDQLSTGEGSLSQIKQTLAQTGQVVEKANNYVATLEQISLKNSIGADYQKDNDLMVDYKMDFSWNPRNSLLIGWDDIGQDNTTTLQWAFTSHNYISRVGIYKNKFGLGLDVPLSSHFLLGINVWDTHSPNIGLSSTWEINPHWSLSLEGESNLKPEDNTWDFELWRNF
jgi:phospholipid/cholesterol/gamma-HCH transport system substrate-binding protein